MEGGAPPPHPVQYPGYPGCAQTPGGLGWNNNTPNQHLANSYSLAGHGQPSPVAPGAGGPQAGGQAAPVPSPLYPWMRSQFGECFEGWLSFWTILLKIIIIIFNTIIIIIIIIATTIIIIIIIIIIIATTIIIIIIIATIIIIIIIIITIF